MATPLFKLHGRPVALTHRVALVRARSHLDRWCVCTWRTCRRRFESIPTSWTRRRPLQHMPSEFLIAQIRAIRNNPAPTPTIPTARAARSPAGASRSMVMAPATTAITRKSMTPRTNSIAVRLAQQ